MSPAAIVSQRTRSDCGVAALATLQGWTYEKARTVLGAHVTDVGACLLSMVAPLLEEGIAGTYFMARDHPGLSPAAADQQTVRHLSTAAEIRRLIAGRRAILGIDGRGPDGQLAAGRGHAIAWDGACAIECGATGEWARPASEISLDAYPIREALILSEIAPSAQPSPAEIRSNDDPDQSLAALFKRHERVFLAFSGGKESITLAHMLEPWRERVTLLWVNTGHMAPHMVEFVRAYRERGWTLEELHSPSLIEHWQTAGTPAEVFPLANVHGLAKPRLQPWLHCCGVIRQEPINVFLRAQDGPACFINGQRRQDISGATVAGLRSQLPPTVEIAMPLTDWSEADVMAYVEKNVLTLPPQYAEGGYSDSLECLPCPAPMNAARMRYLRRNHPEMAAIASAAAETATQAAIGAVAQILSITQPQEAL